MTGSATPARRIVRRPAEPEAPALGAEFPPLLARVFAHRGIRAAEELILSGRMLPAKQLHEMGVIDVLAKDGEAEFAVRDWIAKSWKRRNGTQAVLRARQLIQPITREELDAITEVWVDAALRLEDKDLKMMSRIVRSQMRRMEQGDVTDITADIDVEAAPEAMAATA